MDTHELIHSSDAELKAKANMALAQFETAGGLDKPHLLLQAQFYMAEMSRRQDAIIARRDFLMELVVIALIGFEIVIAFYEGHEQAKVMERQTIIVEKIEKSMNPPGATKVIR